MPSVPSAFWSSPLSDPKRKFRFCLIIPGFEPWIAMKAQVPTYELGIAEHNYLNHTFKYPGRIKWNEITVTLRDIELPDTTAVVMQKLRDSGYYFPDEQISLNNKATVSKNQAIVGSGAAYFELQQLNGDGFPTAVWKLYNAWISKFDYTELDYSSDDLTDLTLTIVYDWARREQGA